MRGKGCKFLNMLSGGVVLGDRGGRGSTVVEHVRGYHRGEYKPMLNKLILNLPNT